MPVLRLPAMEPAGQAHTSLQVLEFATGGCHIYAKHHFLPQSYSLYRKSSLYPAGDKQFIGAMWVGFHDNEAAEYCWGYGLQARSPPAAMRPSHSALRLPRQP